MEAPWEWKSLWVSRLLICIIVCRGDHYIHDDIRADFPAFVSVILKKPRCVRTTEYSRVVIVLQMYPYLLAYG